MMSLIEEFFKNQKPT